MAQEQLCPNCPLKPLFFHEVKRESWLNDNGGDNEANTSLKVCARMRALARQHGILYECPHFNYGLIDQPQQPPPKPKQEKQAPLLMFTNQHKKGDSWNCEGTLYCPDKTRKTNNPAYED